MKRLHYAWCIVLASFLVLFFNSGARYAFGVVFKPIIAEFGWQRGPLSGIFAINMAVFALALLLVGKLYDKYGPRGVLLVSTLLLSGGFVGTSQAKSFGSFLFFYGVLSAFGFAGTAVPLVSTLVSKWFESKKGLAVSLALSGGSLGQFVLVPAVGLLTEALGWREAFLFLGGAVLVVNLTLVLWVIKGDPHQMGIAPYGRKEGVRSGSSGDLTLGQALRTPSLWFFMAMMFICGGGDFFSTTHLVPMATDYGMPPVEASTLLGWYGLMSLLGLLVAGPVSDAMGCRVPIMVTFAIRVAMFLFLYLFKGTLGFYTFGLVFGFTHFVTAPLTPVLATKMYGTVNLGAVTGLINTVHFLGGSLMAYLGGVFFDAFGNYQGALFLMALLSGIAILSTYFIKEVS
ncbi:MAG: hypothetical protein DRG31_06150 [Deltaproteobacteria bacterium]|nr:MAG: hypothetical protein DRG31_06150 [Deltaproteobacteria bacterium]